MNVYRSSTTMQMDAKYKAVKQSRCMTRVITALRSPINKTVSSRCFWGVSEIPVLEDMLQGEPLEKVEDFVKIPKIHSREAELAIVSHAC